MDLNTGVPRHRQWLTDAWGAEDTEHTHSLRLIVLAFTGAGALHANVAHFGKRPIHHCLQGAGAGA